MAAGLALLVAAPLGIAYSRRGTVGGIAGSIASRSSIDQFVKNGYGRIIAQIGGADKDVPQLNTLVKDSSAKDLLALIESTSEIARLTAASPGVPVGEEADDVAADEAGGPGNKVVHRLRPQ